MIFKTFDIDTALGTVLAHTVAAGGRTLRKGHVVTASDIEFLRAHGTRSVVAAQLETSDIPEDQAAKSLAAAVARGGLAVRCAEPFTGRANIVATAHGLLVLDRARLEALNALDERITIATLEPFAVVAPETLVATIKIIPFAVPTTVLAAAEKILTGATPALAVAAFKPKRLGLIITALPSSKPDVLEKRKSAVLARLAPRGATLALTVTVAHKPNSIAQALTQLRTEPLDGVLVFAASAIVDRGDVIPAAVAAAGGENLRLGMPVDPGNLLLLSTLHGRPLVGVPSCAASPKLNGFDWVVDRLLADVDVTSRDIAAMGVGGLLKEIPSRPQPRETALQPTQRQALRISAVVMAAGRSSRMGSEHKLLADLSGKPMIRHAVEALLLSAAQDVTVVVGHRADEVRAALSGLDVRFVDNPAFAEGMATSVATGIRAVPDTADGTLIALGDMPDVKPEDINRLISAFSPADGRAIVVPVRGAKRGNPIIWARAFFAELQGLSGDQGAKRLIDQHPSALVEVELNTDSVLVDIDTPEALASARANRD
ncbi:MAG: hypothetical protein RL291_1522 [Pseudomonadota bacterium]